MSSTRFAAPLRIEPHPSRRLLIYLLLAHGAALAALWSAGLPLWLQLAGSLLLAVNGAGLYRSRVRLRSPRSIVELLWDGEGDWHLTRRDGDVLGATLRPGSLCHPVLVILNFRLETFPWRTSVVLPRDSLPAVTFRRLRVRLRTEGQASASEAGGVLRRHSFDR